MKLTVRELAERLGGELVGDGSAQVSGVNGVEQADERTVTFITDNRHLAALGNSRAAAVIIASRIEGLSKPQLVVKNVHVALIDALNVFAPKLKEVPEGIDESAKVAASAKIGDAVSIGPGVEIADEVQVGRHCVIASGCKIGRNSRLGDNCRLDGNVVIYHNCCIGNNVIIQANSTIGSTGFGYYYIDGSHRLIPHNGGVVIEDFVEIGANCCVDRAKFGNTKIGAGTKIDNLVQIAHNVEIGRCCLIAAQVGIAGSCKIGDGVVFGGQAGVADNIEIGAGAMIGGKAGVTHSVAAEQQVAGSPATDIKEALRAVGLVKRLPRLAEQLKQLGARIERLEAAKDHKE